MSCHFLKFARKINFEFGICVAKPSYFGSLCVTQCLAVQKKNRPFHPTTFFGFDFLFLFLPDFVLKHQQVLLRLPLSNNVLRLVLRDAETSHSVEPLVAHSRTSRWEIRMALPVAGQDLNLELPEEPPFQRFQRKRKRKFPKKNGQDSEKELPRGLAKTKSAKEKRGRSEKTPMGSSFGRW